MVHIKESTGFNWNDQISYIENYDLGICGFLKMIPGIWFNLWLIEWFGLQVLGNTVTLSTVSSWVGNMELDGNDMFAPSTVARSDAGI